MIIAIIIIFHSSICVRSAPIRVHERSRIYGMSSVSVHKEFMFLCGQILFWRRVFTTCNISAHLSLTWLSRWCAEFLPSPIVNEGVLLPNEAPGSRKFILEKYFAHAKFHQCYNGDPQSNFMQHPKINFLNCEPIREIRENLHLGKITYYTVGN